MALGYVTLPGWGRTDALLAEAARLLEADGLRLAGTVQTNLDQPGRSKCAMDLRVLPDGPAIRISQDLGEGARGCRLDAGTLEATVPEVARRLGGAHLLLVNKFGKQEACGRGLAPVIVEAMLRGVPTLVGVNGLNLGPFLAFSDGLAEAIAPEAGAIRAWAARHALRGRARRAASPEGLTATP